MDHSRTPEQAVWDRKIADFAEEVAETVRAYGKEEWQAVVEVERLVRDQLPTIGDGIGLELQTDTLRRAKRRLLEACEMLIQAMGHHSSHWDRTGQGGLGCEACKIERNAKRAAREIMAEVSDET